MAKASVEELKSESQGLRGEITAELQNKEAFVTEETATLLKFHGTYQQDDRDLRNQRKKEGLDKAWSFMVRTKMPSGLISAEQYLAHDRLAVELGCGNMRLTTRQGIQLHGVLKGGLQQVIGTIATCGLTTSGACGDIVRNIMGPASPIDDAAHRDALALSQEVSERFLSKSGAYTELWIDGERVGLNGKPLEEELEQQEDPIYGKTYLPRKFKMAVAVEPRNDVDVYTQDISFVAHEKNGAVEGYTILVGGGFGMSHGQQQTYPLLAKPLFFVPREHVVDAAVAIVTTQRDYGNREDRKRARMKYLIDERGIEWMREQVRERMGHAAGVLEPARELSFDTVSDALGWHEQGDGKRFFGLFVNQGRLSDVTGGPQYFTAFRRLAAEIKCDFKITPNTNVLLCNVDPSQKEAVERILTDCQLIDGLSLSTARQVAHACVALPTCGLSLSESERVFGKVMEQIESELRDLGLNDEPILFRMTGCPNGCARPYNADIGFVGRAPNKYAMYVGGSSRGDRLAGLYKKSVGLDQISSEVKPLLENFVQNRQGSERFTDYWARTQTNGEAPHPSQFHVELEERAAVGARAGAMTE